MFTLVTIVLEIGRGGTGELRGLPWRVVQGLVKNPLPMALLAGLLFHASGLPLPGALDRLGGLIGAAAGPCALFSMGASLRAYHIGGAMPRATLMMTLKMVVHPALVWLLAQAFGVAPEWAAIAVVTAALPCGVNTYLLAERYRIGQPESAAAILVSTVLAVLTLALLLHALGVTPGG